VHQISASLDTSRYNVPATQFRSAEYPARSTNSLSFVFRVLFGTCPHADSLSRISRFFFSCSSSHTPHLNAEYHYYLLGY